LRFQWSRRISPRLSWAVASLTLLLTLVAVTPLDVAQAVSTVTVTTVNDTAPGACATTGTGSCTLREAVIYGNAHPGTVINVPSGSYALSRTGKSENEAGTGDLDVRADMTVNGVGPTPPVIANGWPFNESDRVFDVFPATGIDKITVVFDRLLIQHGYAQDNLGGGGILSRSADLTLTNSVLEQNTSRDRQGGAIASNGGEVNARLTLVNTTLSGNSVQPSIPGGEAVGGAVYVSGGLATIVNSSIFSNRAIGGPASATVDGGRGAGGAIFTENAASELVLINSVVLENIADGGPATGVAGPVRGGIGEGGGAFGAGPSTIVNSSLVANFARGGPAAETGIGGDAYAGGIENLGPLTLTNSTIANNSARGGVAGTIGGAHGGGLIFGGNAGLVTNTIIASNTMLPSTPSDGPDVYIGFPSGGHNLIGVREGGNTLAPSDLSGSAVAPLDPKLADTATLNGGPTKTLALLSGSPAIDAGDNTRCALPLPPAAGPNGAGNVDQRGVSRSQSAGGQCDIGAYEVASAPSAVHVTSSPNPATVLQPITFTIEVSGSASPSGSIEIREGTTSLGVGTVTGGVATVLISDQSEGTHVFSAQYGGDLTLAPSGASIVEIVGSGKNGLQFYPLAAPVRLLDTRPAHDAVVHPSAPLHPYEAVTLPGHFSSGEVSVPNEALALVGNATVDNSMGAPAGFATIYPSDSALPLASNLNFVPGTIRPNSFTVGLGGDGNFNLLSNTGGDFIIDISGYYAPPAPSGLYFHPLPQPVRLLDTRAGASAIVHPGGPLAAGQTINVPGQFTSGPTTVPITAKALVGNATVDNTVGAPSGFATLFPGGADLPPTSSLNFTAGTVAPNAFTVGLGSDGSFNLYSNSGGDFILDVTGYYDTNSVWGLLFRPLAQPVRELDTRLGGSAFVHPNAALAAGDVVSLPGSFVIGDVVVPQRVQALVGNVTIDNTINAPAGFATLFAGLTGLPLASNLNYSPGLVAPNAFVVRVGIDGTYNLFSQSGGNFIIDISGYFAW